MFNMPFEKHSLNLKLRDLKSQKETLEKKIVSHIRPPRGVADFSSRFLQKKQTEVQKEIIKINRLLHPDIIA